MDIVRIMNNESGIKSDKKQSENSKYHVLKGKHLTNRYADFVQEEIHEQLFLVILFYCLDVFEV